LVALHSFELLIPTYTWLQHTLSASATLGSWSISAGGIVTFLLTMYLFAKAAQTLSFFLDQDVLPQMGLARGVPATVSRLTRYAIIALGFIFAVGAAGVDMSKVALVASALSVGIGFGLQNIVNNFVSGLIIIFERPVRVGDTIQLGDLLGDVQSIGIRASTIRTPQGAEAVMPNAELISNRLINWTLSDVKRRIDLPIGVAYGTDPTQVLELLRSAVADVPGVSSYPEPSPIFVGFGESALNFELRVWALRNDEWPLVRSAVAVAINAKLAAAHIEIPVPQRDLHLRSVDAGAAQQLVALTLDGKARGE
jgi:potassium-dependent mechanosensitive channel